MSKVPAWIEVLDPVTSLPEKIINPLAQPEANALKGASNITSDTASVTDFLGRLTSGNTWLRVGEGAVAIVLIYIGVKTLFPSQVAAATTPAKTAAKTGALL